MGGIERRAWTRSSGDSFDAQPAQVAYLVSRIGGVIQYLWMGYPNHRRSAGRPIGPAARGPGFRFPGSRQLVRLIWQVGKAGAGVLELPSAEVVRLFSRR